MLPPFKSSTATAELVTRDAAAVLARATQTAQANQARTHRFAFDPAKLPTRRSDEDIAAEIRQTDERNRRNLVDRLVGASGVPGRYSAIDLDDMTDIPADVRNAYRSSVSSLRGMKNQPGILALIGRRGTGKTAMGCGLTLEFCRAGRPALYAQTMDYFVALKATYSRDSQHDESQIEAKYLRPELLVIDEIHERGDTKWEDRMLRRLIDKRYATGNRSTLLIANLTPETFAESMGDSITDRVRDGGGLVVADWASLRGKVPALVGQFVSPEPFFRQDN